MTASIMRTGLAAVALLLLLRGSASAEWQVRPFLGATFGGGTTFVDLAGAAGSPNVVWGVNGALLGNVIGAEIDFGYAPGFFESGDSALPLVRGSSVTTLTGNVVIAPPRRLTEYTLGPYFVVGGGFMRARSDDDFGVLSVRRTLPAMDIGGGVTGYVSDRFGLLWDARYFWNVGGKELRGVSVDPEDASEQLSFWRAIIAVVIRR
jgi:hypothetical protein